MRVDREVRGVVSTGVVALPVLVADRALGIQSEIEPKLGVVPRPLSHADFSQRSPADRKLAIINILAVTIPFIGLAAAMVLTWGTGFNWTYASIAFGMAFISAVGVNVGYHRLFTHRAFKAPAPVRYALAAMGSIAVQGPVIRWTAEHRRHHEFSDTEGDPHSPHMGVNGSWGEGFLATLRGAYHGHVGWLFAPRTKGLGKYVRDLRRDPMLVLVDQQFPAWVLVGLAIPAVLGGLLTLSWMGVVLGFLWGGLVRVLVVHHITWSVNSICHLWGTKPFDSHDESRNNALVGVLAMGEGWHNNHHAFPHSARHGLRWWELDVTYMIIRMMKLVGLATELRLPTKEKVADKLRAAAGANVR